ncbi:hypothetical protein CHS0354_032952, partial [Potamilus streckersoni]
MDTDTTGKENEPEKGYYRSDNMVYYAFRQRSDSIQDRVVALEKYLAEQMEKE